ncbi:DUF4825 domain-containing protein [Sporosarcina sp. BP05]|uniref:DUF4825 domain-containing protein n=1 Tax=Sporosarcina sp. BP05 TaxID=2758726 RepID=UPI0016440EA6
MRKIINFLIFLLLIMLFLSGCNTNNKNGNLFQYKDSFVGDNSAVGNIANQLRSGENLEGFELKTKEKPYGIILNYDWLESEQNYKETAIFNATFLFSLVQNVDWITFNFDNREYKITKGNLQEWYGKELSEFKNEDELRKYIQEYLKDENKVNQFFN